jgi:hypothetical protein
MHLDAAHGVPPRSGRVAQGKDMGLDLRTEPPEDVEEDGDARVIVMGSKTGYDIGNPHGLASLKRV